MSAPGTRRSTIPLLLFAGRNNIGERALKHPRGHARQRRELVPEVGAGEVDQLVAAAAEHRLDHVEREALGHLGVDGGRDGQLGAGDDGVDQDRAVMGEGGGDAAFDLARILDPDAADARRPRPSPRSRGFSSSVPAGRKPVDFCSTSTKPSVPLLKTTIFAGRPCWTRVRKIAHEHGEAAVARERDDLTLGEGRLGADGLRPSRWPSSRA